MGKTGFQIPCATRLEVRRGIEASEGGKGAIGCTGGALSDAVSGAVLGAESNSLSARNSSDMNHT